MLEETHESTADIKGKVFAHFEVYVYAVVSVLEVVNNYSEGLV